jgi:hypothetical protein
MSIKKGLIPPNFPEHIHIVAIWEAMADEPMHWHVYLLNDGEEPINNALITASGYGELNGKDVKTSLLRYSLGDLSGFSAKRVEPINVELLGLYNQYWVSFYYKGALYDRKFVFPPSSITSKHTKKIDNLMIDGVFAD